MSTTTLSGLDYAWYGLPYSKFDLPTTAGGTLDITYRGYPWFAYIAPTTPTSGRTLFTLSPLSKALSPLGV